MSALSERIARRAGRAGVRRARAAIPSRALRSKCAYRPLGEAGDISSGQIVVPHYWAVIVHDGRKTVKAKPGKVLVWFRNPTLDPRFPGKNHPERLADRRRLTKSEFRYWLNKNKQTRDPSRKPMIVAKQSKAVDSKPFFGNRPGEGMYGFRQEVDLIVVEEIRKEIAEFTKPPSVSQALSSRALVDL